MKNIDIKYEKEELDMKNWKYVLFLTPAILVLICAIEGIHKELPIIKSLTNGVVGSNHTVEAKSIDKNSKSEKQTINKKTESGKNLKQGKWKDGVYFGSATGYGGVIKVSVTIKEGKILKIEVTDHSKETPSFYMKAEAIVQKILSAQSTDVDTISGATFSSNGIRQAVIEALNQAVTDEKDKVTGESNVSKTQSNSEELNKTSKKKDKKTASGLPADGTYVGSAVCEKFGYTISIKVTFKNGKATKIFGLKITENDDSANKAYWVKAYKPTVKKILKNQSSDVDVVSGATYSSNAIMEAFENAKTKAINKNGKKVKKKKKESNSKKKKNEKTVINTKDESTLDPTKALDGTYHVEAVCEPDESGEFEKYYMYADITFSKGKLTGISNITSNAESNQKYYQKAANGTNKYKGVVAQLIEKQSTSGISAVSGATCSSKTILLLYVEGLKKATGQNVQIAIGDSATDNTEKTDSEKGEGETSDGKLLAVKDGTYMENVIVEPDEELEFDTYWMVTEITFKSGTVENMEIISSTDESNQAYYNKALNGTRLRAGILEQLKSNPLKVPDIVTGATCSCNALYEAFKNACIAAGGQ